jgi:hypothetical protein
MGYANYVRIKVIFSIGVSDFECDVQHENSINKLFSYFKKEKGYLQVRLTQQYRKISTLGGRNFVSFSLSWMLSLCNEQR